MLTSPTLRTVALGASAVTLAIALTAAPALTISPSSSASAAVPDCVPGYADYPNLTAGSSNGTDDGTSVYAAGDFTTSSGAVEGEGRFIIGGDSSFAGDHFSLGVVGVGSRVDPPAKSDMLVSGGDVTVTDGFLDVGDRIGGNIVSGGTVTPLDLVETNGGSITENAAAPLAPYASIPTHYTALSADASATPDTGEVRSTADDVTFTGDAMSAVQAFTVSGTELGGLGATKTMVFEGIPADAVVIVNVTGSAPVLSANTFALNGTSVVPDSTSDQLFSRFTQSLLWNFAAADRVTLGDHDQLLGSVLVPKAGSSVTLLTSTNGRIFAGGDIAFGDGERDGLEIHNYPIREPIECETATGTLSITKSLDDPDSVVDSGRQFTGEYECRDAADAVVATGEWSLRAGESFTSPRIPAGSDCVVTEDRLDERPSADDSYHWSAPEIFPATVTVTDSPSPAEVTVTNSVHRLTGDLAVRKVLDDPDGVVSSGRQFTGTFSCENNGADVTPADHTWSVTAGAAAATIATGLPEGTECSLVEDALIEKPLADSVEYGWATPLYSAASVSIDHTATATVVVTNIVGQVGGESENPPGTNNNGHNDKGTGDSGVTPAATPGGSALAATGVNIAGPLALGGGLLGLGLALVVIARRRNLLKRS